MSLLTILPRLALGLAAIYVGFSPRVAKGLYTNMLFHPYAYPEGDYESGEVGGIAYEDIFFQAADGTKLHGWYFEHGAERQTILLSHGNTGNIAGRRALLEGLLRTGANIFIYDYRGYGRSEGKPDVPGLIDDACAAYDWLIARGITEKKIILYGESLGGAVSCQLSTRKPAAGLILQSSFSSLHKIGREHVPLMHIYPASLFPQPHLDSAAILRGTHPPLLVLHGERDAVVPLHHGEELYENASGEKTLVSFPDAQHADIPMVAQDKFVEAIRMFLTELCFAF